MEDNSDTATIVNITGNDDDQSEHPNFDGFQDLGIEGQDEPRSQQHVDMTDDTEEALLVQSMLPDIESSYANTMSENSDELDFLDSNRLFSAVGSLGNGTSNGSINDLMHMDHSASLLPDEYQAQIHDDLMDDTLSFPIGSTAENDQKRLNSFVDLDTEELYKDVASLDISTLKESQVYSAEPKSEMQNPDPLMPTDVDDGESDHEKQPETQPLELALQSRHEDDELVQGAMASSMLQADEDQDDPICSISIPSQNGQIHSNKKDHDHKHEQGKDSGYVCQDLSTIRKEAWDAAQDVLKRFGLVEESSRNEQRCEGHKETIFGVSFSECGSFCATASQDATIKIWDLQNNKLLASLEEHSKDFECLRVAWASSSWSSTVLDRTTRFKYLLASSGADGTVRLWACQDPRSGEEGGWKCYLALDHSHFAVKRSIAAEGQDKPQIYTLQFINHWEAFGTFGEDTPDAFLMTSSEDYLHFWSLGGLSTTDQDMDGPICPDRLRLKEVISLQFGSTTQYGYGVSVANVTDASRGSGTTQLNGGNTRDSPATIFGGERNPDNVVYVFDASFCSANGLVGVALSDGTLRLINGRGICVCILNVLNSRSHLTSCTWDKNGSRLLTTVATGQLVSWKLREKDDPNSGYTKADHLCTFEGGHQAGRPLFGARYYGGDAEELIISWSMDGSLCLWDSESEGHVTSPMAVLRQYGPSPLYAVEFHSNQSIAIGGAETECCSHGVPLYLYRSQERTANGMMDDLD